MKLKHFLSIFVMAALLASCAKEGPAGPQGPAGTNGVANISTQIYAISPITWNSNGNGGWYVNLTPVFDPTGCAVSLLYSTDETNWFGLPYIGNTVGDVDINYVVNSSNIQVEYVPQTGAFSIAAPSGTVYVQVSIIPPAIQVKYPNVNWKDALEVANLPEVQAALAKTK